jgi:DNA-binding SARP family transcriptional activator
MLEMRFLGLPEISCDGRPLAAFKRSPTLMRLLVFLVIHCDQPQHRLCLATRFWPELPEPRARRTLNNTLWRLRVALGECDSNQPYVQAVGETLQFNPQAAFWLDVREFERLTDTLKGVGGAPSSLSAEQLRRIEAAVELYRGDLLEGIYDDWCEVHRERLRQRYLLALETLSGSYGRNGRHDLALEVARQMVQTDPYRESAHRLLIEHAIALGRPAEAKTHFASYCAIWRDELNLAPSPSMLELAARHDLAPALVPSLPRSSAHETTTALEAMLDAFVTSPANTEYLRRELDIRRRCDELYDLMANRKKQAENLEQAEALAIALADPAARADVLARRIWLATRQGEYEAAIEMAKQALDWCSDDPVQRAMIHRLAGIANQEQGDFEAALGHYSEALALDERHGQATMIPTDLNNVASVQLARGDYAGALINLERALGPGSEMLVPPVRVKLLGNAGIAWMKLGNLDKAASYLKTAMALAQSIGARGAEWWLGARLALLHHLNGDTERALLLAHHHHRAAQPVGDAWVVADLLDALSKIYCDAGDGERALSWASELCRYVEGKRLWRFQLRGLMRLAASHDRLGQTEAARAAIRRALDLRGSRSQPLDEDVELSALVGRILWASRSAG